MVRNISSRVADPVADALPELRNFSLVLGGPLYQLFRKAHLDDDVVSHLTRRILVICGIVWLPLLLLCAIIREMRGLPFSREMLVQLLWATLAPFSPLVFTMIPLEELLDRILKSVF